MIKKTTMGDKVDNHYSWMMPLVRPNMKTKYVHLRLKENLLRRYFNYYGDEQHIQNVIGRWKSGLC